MKEMRLKQLRKEVLTVDEAVRVVDGVFGEMRTEGVALMDDFARDFNLNADVLRRRFLSTMAGPFALDRELFEKLANDFSRESLP